MPKSTVAEIVGIEVDPCHGGMSLADFEWRYRVLIIFPDDAHIEATRQANLLLAEAEALRERDIIVLEVGHDDVKALFGPQFDLNPRAIRYDLDVTGGFFALRLVGKDGSVKLRSDEVVAASAIFELTDQTALTTKPRN